VRNNVMTGVVLVAVGLIFLASNLGTLPDVDFGQLWPLILTVIGVGKLVAPGEDGRWGGVSLILMSGIFLAHNYRVLRLHDSWPLFIVLVGLSIVFHARNCRVRGAQS
jgi:hypothetical protein